MTELPKGTHVIVIRRGSAMRVSFPFLQYALSSLTAPELARLAVPKFMELQMSAPGRADMPITSKTGPMALALPGADGPLDRYMPLWSQLAGTWTQFDHEVMGEMAPYMKSLPATVLSLIDLHPGA